MKRGWWIGKFLVMGLAMFTIIGFVTMWLWNWLVPELFNGPVITFWKALGLIALSKILFWSFGGGRGHRHAGPWKPYWQSRYWNKKWETMTPDDRERFKQKMKEKWCHWDDDTRAQDSGVSNG